MRHSWLPALLISLGALSLAAPAARAQMDPAMDHQHHNHSIPTPNPMAAPMDHGAHAHDVGPAGATYDLRFIDGMVQHHTGALRMSEFIFDIGEPGVGSLGKSIWRDQANEIRAMGLWRKAWYPEAPNFPVALAPGGDPNSLSGLTRMSQTQIEGMRMMGSGPTRENRVVWFIEGMLEHHGGALMMAHDALAKSTNTTIRRFARDVILAQRAEIIELRRMLAVEGLRKPEYHKFDALFRL
ncbi:DUF305 domain-containing protein [Synechococcus sp. Cruz-9H2]|uniref:DUF305 domain-containing protein n=1 Tax=unclassified Synechococcus TaxID=2626047 RepID=UPI0020CED90A|nr:MULTISPECIES: DUF305 domain-containing protein [unclassified Synechococcus]MCP9820727.1 DUF305 domain-containing protein [Synechococcus sp. Cruz-9H2]MCP9845017.1 DUF305 domain-containing protein [Synechococcus sp. Edmonson 11F2]MCP9857138.1 DUF305 domain-containing protein [Synechococcus sp. Cruz-9C9]MCP9864423.1 DUF305 domain-containing protein [Synechococcus sp. Cruz-7E5]MCP9871637.1 DUF305 domain-containing protein [Synechococcus sp. Cruz-7B9]